MEKKLHMDINSFVKNIDTPFMVSSESYESSITPGMEVEVEVELELAIVKQLDSPTNSFSLTFVGPSFPLLDAGTYKFIHETIGEFYLFIKPISDDDEGISYQAVLNY